MPDTFERVDSSVLRGRDAARTFCRVIADDEPLIFEGFFPRDIAREKDDHGRRVVGTFDQCQAELEGWELEGRSIYLHPNPGGTTKGSITHIRVVSIEFDAPGEGHAKSQTVPAEWLIEPTAIVRRGASLQAHWAVKDCAVDRFIELQRRLQGHYRSDARTIGEWRLWRVPGFQHPAHPGQDVELVIDELSEINGPYSVATLARGLPELPPEEPRDPLLATGEPVPLADLRAMLSFIDPTFSGDDGAWIGIAKAIHYGELPTNDTVDWESLCDDWSSGSLWHERTADREFFVPTYHDSDTMRARISDGPRSAGQKVGIGTVWKLARDGGYPGGRPGERLIDRLDSMPAEQARDDAPSDTATPSFTPPVAQSFASVMASPPVPVDHVIPGRLERYLVNFLRGPGDHHKGRMVLQGGMCAQAGHPFFGAHPVGGLRFVHLPAEDDANEIRRRIHAIRNGLQLGDRADGARYIDAYAIGLPIIVAETRGTSITWTDFGKWLRAELRAMPGHKLVTLDAFYNFFRFDSASLLDTELVRFLIQNVLTEFCRDTESTLWIPWHPSFAGQARGDGASYNVAFHNAPRVADLIEQKGKDFGIFTLRAVKRNNGPKPAPVDFIYRDGALIAPSGQEQAARDENFKTAVIETAMVLARQGAPITQRSHIDRVTFQAIRKALADPGYPFDEKAIREQLRGAAIMDKSLVYVLPDNRHAAGYYPAEEIDLAIREGRDPGKKAKAKGDTEGKTE